MRVHSEVLTSSCHTDDVLKARLKTVGVSEYRFEMEAGSESGTQWRIIDVGGSRSQVSSLPIDACARKLTISLSDVSCWTRLDELAHTDKYPQRHGCPFLMMVSDNFISIRRSPMTNAHIVDAIIFLAPISGFDQTLAEDRSVNRLVSLCSISLRRSRASHLPPYRVFQEDSVLLWKSICSNKLLARVDLVLFLNKCDILAAKLNSGVRLAKYVKSFGERSNDADTAEKCEYCGIYPLSRRAEA